MGGEREEHAGRRRTTTHQHHQTGMHHTKTHTRRDNMDDHMVNVIPQLNLNMRLK